MSFQLTFTPCVNFRSAMMHNYCLITYRDTTHKAAIMKLNAVTVTFYL